MHLRTSIVVSLLLLTLGCTKKNNNTTIINNTYNNDAIPAYVILGLHDLEFIYGFSSIAELGITIQYMDSVQQTVKLSLSSLPEGLQVDSNWIKSGIPTYNTTIRFRYNSISMTPGSYPITLTATNDSGQQKLFHININVTPIPITLMGKYTNCRIYCPATTVYTDSLYLDPIELNKIWFTNFRNLGNLVYGYLTGSGQLVIPEQISGTMTYSYSSGSFNFSNRHINMSFGSSCAMDME